MDDKIKRLIRFLDDSQLVSEAQLVSGLLKMAFIDNAFILIDTQSSRVTFNLMGARKGDAGVRSFGSAFAYPLDSKASSPFGNKTFWHIHIGEINSAYKGLRYGQDIYLAAIKYITDSGGMVLSAPLGMSSRTDDVIKLWDNISKASGVNVVPVMVVSPSYGGEWGKWINMDKIENLTGEYREIYSNSSDIGHYPLEYITKKTKREIFVSTGIVAHATGSLPISIPVRFGEFSSPDYRRSLEEQEADEERDDKVNEIRNIKTDGDESYPPVYQQTEELPRAAAQLASALLEKEADTKVRVPDDLIEVYQSLVKKMSELDPETRVRVGGWDIGNFGQPAYTLGRYNDRRGGIPIVAERGISVRTLIDYFNEDDEETPTGFTLVKLMDNEEVNELWIAAKQQVDKFVSEAML
jgi:hypothetical protein